MIDRLTGWLKRRSENSQVTYSRFGLPGDEVDERAPPTQIHVAHFDDDAPEFRAFFTHSTRAAAVAAGFGLSCSVFSFVMFLFEFRWEAHGGGADFGTLIGSLLFLIIGTVVHWQVLIGIKKESAMNLIPAIMVYSFLIIVELVIYILAANHIVNSSLLFTYPPDKNTPTFLTLSVFYLTVMGVQAAMLLSICKARTYFEAKEAHRKEVQIAENGKRQNPQMQIVYVKPTEVIAPMTTDAEATVLTSPPPRVILAANDEIA
ncbi:hypothetical protein L5515_002575 [Caenorhabditis briggsae]|uniref:Uncharacterized protein n=2 Tax=Caenorhabditis briggsae TaxID=6238 RepID=A0AAE9E8E8_CAEBR|nr:hypothetical protein L5515_002575 [Caenorhabditis briggsae]